MQYSYIIAHVYEVSERTYLACNLSQIVCFAEDCDSYDFARRQYMARKFSRTGGATQAMSRDQMIMDSLEMWLYTVFNLAP